jgi:hypothetical protein
MRKTAKMLLHARVVAHDRQILFSCITERKDLVFWNATQAESTDGKHHALFNQSIQCRQRVGIDLVHRSPFLFFAIGRARKPISFPGSAEGRRSRWRCISSHDRGSRNNDAAPASQY